MATPTNGLPVDRTILLQVTRKEKGMATILDILEFPDTLVAGDPKREGYGNFKVSFLLCLLISLQVTRKEKGMATQCKQTS